MYKRDNVMKNYMIIFAMVLLSCSKEQLGAEKGSISFEHEISEYNGQEGVPSCNTIGDFDYYVTDFGTFTKGERHELDEGIYTLYKFDVHTNSGAKMLSITEPQHFKIEVGKRSKIRVRCTCNPNI